MMDNQYPTPHYWHENSCDNPNCPHYIRKCGHGVAYPNWLIQPYRIFWSGKDTVFNDPNFTYTEKPFQFEINNGYSHDTPNSSKLTEF